MKMGRQTAKILESCLFRKNNDNNFFFADAMKRFQYSSFPSDAGTSVVCILCCTVATSVDLPYCQVDIVVVSDIIRNQIAEEKKTRENNNFKRT